MTLEQIEKKIQELKKKLQEKRPIEGRGKAKKFKSIPVFYCDHIIKELEELNILNKKVLYPVYKEVEVDWNCVQFDDGLIRIRFDHTAIQEYRFKYSRKSFEFLKPSFDSLNLPVLFLRKNIGSAKVTE